MDIRECEAGLVGYKKARQVFLRLLRRYKAFSEQDFDRWFRHPRRLYKLRSVGVMGDSFLLGAGTNDGTLWAEMLDLLQWMIRLGQVSAKKSGTLIIYELETLL